MLDKKGEVEYDTSIAIFMGITMSQAAYVCSNATLFIA